MKRRIIAILLLLSLSALLCGCGVTLNKEEQYVSQDAEQLSSIKSPSKIGISGDILLVSFTNSDGEPVYISFINATGKTVEKNGLEWLDGTSVFRNHTYLGDFDDVSELNRSDYSSEDDYFVAWAMRRIFLEARVYAAGWAFAVHAGGDTNYTDSDGVSYTLVSGENVAKYLKMDYVN